MFSFKNRKSCFPQKKMSLSLETKKTFYRQNWKITFPQKPKKSCFRKNQKLRFSAKTKKNLIFFAKTDKNRVSP